MRRGSSVSRPAVSVSSTRRSAPTRWATSAASRSLSPKRISSSATASFSLTTGTTPSSSSRARVWRACRYWLRWTKSSGASRTWPAASPRAAEGVAPHLHQPVLADGGDRLEGGRGRTAGAFGRERWTNPAAIAPEVTTTTRSPRRAGLGHLGRQLARWRRRPPGRTAVVTDDEPILTTTRPTGAVGPASVAVTGAGAGGAGSAGELGLVADTSSKESSPMWTRSPSRAPARARARSTPIRRSRALDVVGGLVGGDVVEGHGPLGGPSRSPRKRPRRSAPPRTPREADGGSTTIASSARGSAGSGLVHQRGEPPRPAGRCPGR